jgi:hypothetical protein
MLDKDITQIDRIASSRQRVRFNAVNDAKYSGHRIDVKKNSSQMPGARKSEFFENTNYSFSGNAGELGDYEDDDPFYEIYDCHKVSYIERKLQDPLN